MKVVGDTNLCNRRGSTRREQTIVSSITWDLRNLACEANPEVQPEQRVASWQLANATLAVDRFSYVPRISMHRHLSHRDRSCCAPAARMPPLAPPGQPETRIISKNVTFMGINYLNSTRVLRGYFENIPLKSCNIARIFIKLLERLLKYCMNLATSV